MNKLFFNKNTHKGSTLLEALIALSAIVIILAAASSLVITSLNNSTFSRNQNQAGKLAQEGMEYIRAQLQNRTEYNNYRDNLASSIQCFNVIDNASSPFTPGACSTANVSEIFKREALFENLEECAGSLAPAGSTGIKATVTVYFQSGKCPIAGSSSDNTFCHKQELSSCFPDPGTLRPTLVP